MIVRTNFSDVFLVQLNISCFKFCVLRKTKQMALKRNAFFTVIWKLVEI